MDETILHAADLLRSGKLVAFPTETVYGLGADATNSAAVKKIFAAKGRPATNPLIAHVGDIQVAKKYAARWPESAEELARQFWPGPLTLVLPKAASICDEATAGKKTVGLRAPDHPLALALLKGFGGAVAAPSANRSNRVSPTTAQHVRDELGDAVDEILDGGPCLIGIESTVLDLSQERPTILRPGAVTREEIERIIGAVQMFEGSVNEAQAASSPGQQAVHYAPRAMAFRFTRSQRREVVRWCRDNQDESWAVLYLGPLESDVLLFSELEAVAVSQTPPSLHKLIQMPAAAKDYARRLYGTLRELDDQQISTLWIEMPPEQPQWLAVRDRLQRATRPSPFDLDP